MSLWAIDSTPTELRQDANEDDLQTIIRAVYKQVLGNQHLMESQRLSSAESLLRDRSISVRDFVRIVGKSELYKALFFNSSSQYRFIELNFKHFLGRAPQDQSEISEHVCIYKEKGYEAEIDSYIDSDEYQLNFGEHLVPYLCSTRTQRGVKNVAFNRTFALARGMASSDRDTKAKLIGSVGGNLPTPIKAPIGASGAVSNTGKRFLIKVSKSAVGPRPRLSNMEYVVDYNRMSEKVQNIHKMGGKIISIAEVA